MFGPIDIAYIYIYTQGFLGLSWVLVAGYQVVVWDQHGFGFRLSFWRPYLKRPPCKAALNVM